MNIKDIIIVFVLFQVGNWFSYFALDVTIKTALASLYFTGVFTILLCVLTILKEQYETD